ncbi:RDD family protein [Legionella oakridgensis]|nr:RDD family protein [Legionella oakridgensis]ETO94165.1 RDD family [Legionella oakridgensis RV-2-2007]KTD43850.1 RDD family protein [Legionella oakridgensis]
MYFFRYLGALIYDTFVLFTLFVVFTATCLLFRHGNIIEPGTCWYQLSLASIVYYYYFLSYRYGGQTIGLRAWKMKLVSCTYPLKQKQILARFLLMFPALLYGAICLKNPMTILKQWTKCQITTV